MLELAKEKRGHFCTVYFVRRTFLKNFVLSQCIVYWIHFQNIHTFTYQKTLLHTLLLLVSNIVEDPRVSLRLKTRLLGLVSEPIRKNNNFDWKKNHQTVKCKFKSMRLKSYCWLQIQKHVACSNIGINVNFISIALYVKGCQTKQQKLWAYIGNVWCCCMLERKTFEQR